MVIKVAILGGGVGGITTAFALTSTPELREQYEVTVYQRGWRLGGKGASGRNAAMGQRIEEHGLHVWFGFYDNAFRLIDDCYTELDRPTTHPLHSRATAFTPCDRTVLYTKIDNTWHPWVSVSPRTPVPYGTDEGVPLFWSLLSGAVNWAHDAFERLLGNDELPERSAWPHWVADALPGINAAGRVIAGTLAFIGDRLADLFDSDPDERHPHLCRMLAFARDALWDHYAIDRQDDVKVRRFFTAVDTVITAAIGMLADGVLNNGFTTINEYELTEWLKAHGLHEITYGKSIEERAPVLRAIYDMAFCFLDGNVDTPAVAAGTALRNMILLGATANTSLYSKMNAGMGDAIFAPYYEVLTRRGVRFEFFSWITNIGTADRKTVTSIELVPQAPLKSGTYDPLVTVQGVESWPSEPRWDQLIDGEALRAAGYNFEFAANPIDRPVRVLEMGVDFDEVVLAIPSGALPAICGDLAAANPRFETMLESSRTVMTQAFQLWMHDDVDALGFPGSTLSLAGSYVEPLDTYADMSHVLDREVWGAHGPASVGYFCGVLSDKPGETSDESTARAKTTALEFIRNDLEVLWPNAFDNGIFRWDRLFDPTNQTGEARFNSQYWRANSDTSERYVLSPPKLVLDRLGADESGFSNLKLAGDWTRNGLNAGCVEAATISGLQAARAISQHPFTIVAEDDNWLTNRKPA